MTCGSMTPAVLLDTLTHEKHARGALLVTFLEDLTVACERAPASTRELLARAQTTALSDEEVDTILVDLRAVIA